VSYLFLFRAYPDVDHISPLAWKLLKEGEEVHAVVARGYDADADHHLRLLQKYERFHLHRARSLVHATLPWAILTVARCRARVVAVEWGPGPRADNRFSWRGFVAVLRRLAGSVRSAARRDPAQLRSNFVLAAWLLGRAAVCLPHGLSIKLDNLIVFGEQAERFERESRIDWDDRNRFAAYVLNTEHHRRWQLDHAGGDPAIVQAWGSLRWSPEWFQINRNLAPTFRWPDPSADRLKVLFMVPKWRNRTNADAARELVKRMQELDFVSLAIKGHPRKEGAADPLRVDPGIDWGRIHDLSAIDSVALIAASDVVIDVGSSIGIEAVMQGKALVNPSYVHRIHTLFDSIEGSCVRASSPEEVVNYLRAHAAGTPHRVPGEAYSELLRRAVYADRKQPFDVLGLYATRVKALAGTAAEAGYPNN
jgi:hypothetical protein